jgi:hypothetical protein
LTTRYACSAGIVHHVAPATGQIKTLRKQLWQQLRHNRPEENILQVVATGNMPHAAVKAYKQVLALLDTQQALLSQTDSPAARTQLDKVTKQIADKTDALVSISAVPLSAWKTIIKDMEVSCFKLAVQLIVPSRRAARAHAGAD